MIDPNDFGKNMEISFCPHCRTRNRNGGSLAVRCTHCRKIYRTGKLPEPDTGMKMCPECLEMVKKEASRCCHCGHEFRPVISLGGTLSAAGFVICLLAGFVMMLFGLWLPMFVVILFGIVLHRIGRE